VSQKVPHFLYYLFKLPTIYLLFQKEGVLCGRLWDSVCEEMRRAESLTLFIPVYSIVDITKVFLTLSKVSLKMPLRYHLSLMWLIQHFGSASWVTTERKFIGHGVQPVQWVMDTNLEGVSLFPLKEIRQTQFNATATSGHHFKKRLDFSLQHFFLKRHPPLLTSLSNFSCKEDKRGSF
jgi:hypothetical protein